MRSLHDMQKTFASALAGSDAAALASCFVAHDRQAPERLDVYRNNAREVFISALSASYPVLKRLTGEKYFRQMAVEYQRAFPMRRGNLAYAGQWLPEHLYLTVGGGDYDYFIDVARLEWACELALIAADRAATDPVLLASIATEQYPNLQPQLHPSVSLLRSDYPVLRIWQQNQPGADSDEIIDLLAGGDCLLVRRDDVGLALHRLDAAEWAFLEAVTKQRRLADAYAAASSIRSGFDLSACLGYWVAQKIIVGWSLNSN